jgi:hypothetical protein
MWLRIRKGLVLEIKREFCGRTIAKAPRLAGLVPHRILADASRSNFMAARPVAVTHRDKRQPVERGIPYSGDTNSLLPLYQFPDLGRNLPVIWRRISKKM